MFSPLRDKVAEPPPPKGVSVKEWDKILQEGPKPVVKTAAPIALIREASNALAFQSLTEHAGSTADVLLSMKLAAVEDADLLQSVYQLSGDLHQAVTDYEQMGGKYKSAFGSPMFESGQLAGSPAVASGMQMRANTQAQQQAAAAGASMQQSATTPKAQGTTSAPSLSSPSSASSTPAS